MKIKIEIKSDNATSFQRHKLLEQLKAYVEGCCLGNIVVYYPFSLLLLQAPDHLTIIRQR